MNDAAAVLVVEDERGLREGLVAAVETLGHRALAAAGIDEARRTVAATSVDCILLDIRLRDGDGLVFLEELRKNGLREVPVIMLTAYGDSERTIRAMRDGAFEYLTKPFDLPTLLATVERAVRQRSLAQALPALPSPMQASTGEGGLIGTSAAMLAVWKLIGRAAASNSPVLITGETGVGKELVARAIHEYSARAQKPFVAVNVAALPPTLIESELFGHERGAFTGANARRNGRFEQASDGTLFLDEIGDLDLALQTKLLRVLQDGSFERVGGSEHFHSGARIIAATSKTVRPSESGAAVRDDLYYRLAVIEIEVPPLRMRRSDIPLLAAHALEHSPARAVSEEAMARLIAYDWPGNVRELLHVLERAAVLCGGDVVDASDLPDWVKATSPRLEPAAPDKLPTLREAIAQLEKRLIVQALERARGNRSEAARLLAISRAQLYAKMDEHGIGPKQDGPPPSD